MLNIRLENLGTINQNEVVIETDKSITKLYFSYETIVAFDQAESGKYTKAVSVNDWSRTTGKLLNKIEPDKKARVKSDQFNKLLRDCLIRIS